MVKLVEEIGQRKIEERSKRVDLHTDTQKEEV